MVTSPAPTETAQDQPWWVQQWVDLLNSYRFKKRLERARSYAREGHVLRIEFVGPKVLADVQGTELEPYKVSLSLNPFRDEEWSYVIESMSKRAIFAAKLLAGEMPANIEEVFTQNGLSLFPFSLAEIRSRCSCPDKANPCKHIGAVYYLLGDRFSEDPFVLFQLRGRTREQILTALRQLRSQGNPDPEAAAPSDRAIAALAPTLGPTAIAQFWHYTQPLEPSLVVISPPPSSETILDTLGPIPFASNALGTAAASALSSQAAMQYLQTVYQATSQQAVIAGLSAGGGD
ncbi:SWIM zinc finger family protein [Trichothermofontia sp.]